jgi:hypothetical protein
LTYSQTFGDCFFLKVLILIFQHLRLEDEELWAKLREWDDVGYSMSCPSRGDYKGIMAGECHWMWFDRGAP